MPICVLCRSELENIESFENFPVFMGAGDGNKRDTLIFSSCQKCCHVQLGHYADLADTYSNNHNLEVVGETWTEHFRQLKDFTEPHLGNDVLEIGDATGKLSSHFLDKSLKWEVVEPNPALPNSEKRIFHKCFFEDFSTEKKYDCILHSHVLEHALDPISFLSKCRHFLKPSGKLIMSIPNMKAIVDNHRLPVLALNFEHVYYLDELVARVMLSRAGFRVVSSYAYKSHSIFFECTPAEATEVSIPLDISRRIRSTFINNFHFSRHNGIEINKKIKETNKKVYMFGCHIPTQFLLNTQINESDCFAILDNATSKQGKKLYGTNLNTLPPATIADQEAAVVTSHTGMYAQEINKQLLSINPNVEII